jgi:hypothetical protein
MGRISQKLKGFASDRLNTLDYIFKHIKYKNRLPTLSQKDNQIIQDIKKTGVSLTSLDKLSLPLTDDCLKAANYLKQKLQMSSLSMYELSNNPMSAASHRVYSDPIEITTNFPEIVQWGLQDRVLDLVENIIGVPAAFVGLTLRREILNNKQTGTRLWHVDGEDYNSVKITIYLNDVDEDTGPFEYIPKSAVSPLLYLWRINFFNFAVEDAVMEKIVPASQWHSCPGQAGTVIISNTGQVFHRGKIPKKERFALMYSYTSRNPKRPSVCKSETFRKGLPYLSQTLNQRQIDSVYDANLLLKK